MVLKKLNVHMQKKKKKKVYTDIILISRINSKWNVELNIKSKTVKLLLDMTKI